MATANELLRERIRRNVGHRPNPLPFHGAGSKAAPWIVEPSPRFPEAPPGEIPTYPGLRPTDGRTYALCLTVAAGVREVVCTPRIGFPFQLRKINLTGDVVGTDAYSFRLLLSPDGDTSAVAEPTGEDLYEVIGDVIGAEDPGLHAALTNGTLVLEPWTLVREQGKFLKLKVHNAAAAQRNITAFFDVDILEPEILGS